MAASKVHIGFTDETKKYIQFGSPWNRMAPMEVRKLPDPPWKMTLEVLGPGIVLAVGSIGSGEMFFWPYLVSHYGPAIFWLFFYGALMQYWFHAEAQRYQIFTGESLYQGVERVIPHSAYYWLISGWFSALWPGFPSLIATGLKELVGVPLPVLYGTAGWEGYAFILTFVSWGLGLGPRVIYRFLRRIAFWLVAIMMVLGTMAAAITMTPESASTILTGMFIGYSAPYCRFPELGPLYIPAGVDWVFLLGAISYAGSSITGGLGYSVRGREHGWGMGYHVPPLTGLLGKPMELPPVGYAFDYTDPEEIKKYRRWMRIVFWDCFGLFIMCTWWGGIVFTAGVNNTLVPRGIVISGIRLAVEQGWILRAIWGMPGWYLMLFLTFITLWSTGWMVTFWPARVTVEIFWFKNPFGIRERIKYRTLYIIVGIIVGIWHMIVYASGMFAYAPVFLISMNAFISGLATPLILPATFYLSNRLPKEIRPDWKSFIFGCADLVFYMIFWILWLLSQFGIRI